MRRPEQSHSQLERELEVLSNQEFHDSESFVSVKQRVRVIKNRLSAKRSREQARDYVEQLESNVAYLASESDALARRLAQVEEENRKLREAESSSKEIQSNGCVEPTHGSQVEEEKRTTLCEPAVLPQSSLQLDALFFFLSMAAMTSGPPNGSAHSTPARVGRAIPAPPLTGAEVPVAIVRRPVLPRWFLHGPSRWKWAASAFSGGWSPPTRRYMGSTTLRALRKSLRLRSLARANLLKRPLMASHAA
mmetsp:Transcript_57350/g.117388  ORF Transcript_57350/g.117388 Transcript_57350/m.117388 type:complete len:248 (-) Transcript_57350:349-1092(-)